MIAVRPTDRTFEVFIGSNRGALNPTQRAEVLVFAQNWRHESTSGVIVNLLAGASNERSAVEAMREIASILTATGVPADTIRMTYPRIAAQAGPCGSWPQDIRPSLTRDYFENQPYRNLRCSSQCNPDAMMDNPADRGQPRERRRLIRRVVPPSWRNIERV